MCLQKKLNEEYNNIKDKLKKEIDKINNNEMKSYFKNSLFYLDLAHDKNFDKIELYVRLVAEYVIIFVENFKPITKNLQNILHNIVNIKIEHLLF